MQKSLVVAALAALFLAGCEDETPEVTERIRAIKTYTVSQHASGRSRKFPGAVEATDTSSLSFEVSGNVTKVLVDAGDKVVAGQELAELDAEPYRLDVQSGEADLGSARAGFNEKSLELERQKALFAKGWISQAALDQAVAAFETAKNDVDIAQSKLSRLRRDLGKTVMRAPFDGVIATRSVDPFVEVNRGQALFEIFAEGALQIALSIPETVIEQINLGLPAAVNLSSFGACECTAVVTEIGSSAETANAFPVKATLLNPPTSVRPGMTAEVEFLLGIEDTASNFLIPIDAVAAGSQSGQPINLSSYVFVFDAANSTVQKRAIKIGPGTGSFVEVQEGVEPGDVIAAAGVSFLSDGLKVKLLSE
ncbi:MAG: efflux RND transporter periplasmic adaptor subunit [Alphaproteobacteria bacterium]|nr:efflux RND transporter periplasmic adaptor subunit [Alphaproteobacteria bacterium]